MGKAPKAADTLQTFLQKHFLKNIFEGWYTSSIICQKHFFDKKFLDVFELEPCFHNDSSIFHSIFLKCFFKMFLKIGSSSILEKCFWETTKTFLGGDTLQTFRFWKMFLKNAKNVFGGVIHCKHSSKMFFKKCFCKKVCSVSAA